MNVKQGENMYKIYQLKDKQHNGMYVFQDKAGYHLMKAEVIYDKVCLLPEEGKFHMLPYFLRDTDVYDEYAEVEEPDKEYTKNILELYDKAVLLALEKHKNQVDKNNKPYINHILRVASQLKYLEDRIIALLHDTLEDTDTTEEELLEVFPEFIVEAVKSLTRDKEKETYQDFIKRCALNDIAVNIKIADLKDNYFREMDVPEPKLKERYKKALEFLGEEI